MKKIIFLKISAFTSKNVKVALICLLMSAGLFACTSKNQHSTGETNILNDTLQNGLRVVIIRDTLAPMVTTQITYLAGGYETPEGYPGTAHAVEHMMFRGSKGLNSSQLFEIAGKLGGQFNAFTTMDATQYFYMAPSQYLDILLHIEASRMNGAFISDSGWALEKGAIEQEVSRDISSPSFLAYKKADSILFAGTGYATTALGTRPSFDKTTSSLLRKFYDQWYVPNNAIFVIAGDVNPKATFSKVKQLFDSIPRSATPERVPLQLTAFEPQTIQKTVPQGTGAVWLVYRMPGQRSKKYAAAEILMDVLNNARSHLSKLVVKGKILNSFAGMAPFAHGGLGVVIGGFPKGGNSQQIKTNLDSVLNIIIEKGVPEDLVNAAKQSELAQFEFNKNSAMTLATAWSNALAWQGLSSLDEAEQEIRDVTPEDVNQIARQYLKPDQRVTVILTPNPNGKRPPNSRGFGGTETFAGNDKLDVPLPAWASESLSKIAMPHWTLNPTKMELSNGITLIVQPESISKTVTVRGYIDHQPWLQEPLHQEGVGQLLSSLFDYGNTDMSRDSFHKALDEISASEYGGTSFGLAVPSAHFDRGMQLLADNELHPALPDSGFKVQQKNLASSLTGEMQSPFYKRTRALDEGLYPSGDPALRQATPATVNALTLQDVKNYFSQVYRPDMTTLVVVGNVTPGEAKSVVEKYFGKWSSIGPKPQVILKPVPLNPAKYAMVNNSYASQDQVSMSQMLNLNLKDTDRYALQLGNEVLGGNSFASRLMMDIRVKHGYAYGAGSGINIGRTRTIFTIRYGCDPDKVAAVDSLVYKNIAQMQNTPVNEKELQNARQAEIRRIPIGVSSVDAIANSLLSWSWHGEPLDQPMVAAKHYLNISAQEIQDAFKQYVKPNNLVQVVLGPAPAKH